MYFKSYDIRQNSFFEILPVIIGRAGALLENSRSALSDFPLTSRGQGHQVTGELDDFLWERPTGGDRR